MFDLKHMYIKEWDHYIVNVIDWRMVDAKTLP